MYKNRIKKVNYPELFQTDSSPYGRTYVKWTEKWWQWVFSIPKDQSPIIDRTGKNCAICQKGPVWYLGGTTGSTSHAIRSCVIPHRKSILFPIIVSQFSRSEKPNLNYRQLISYTAKDIDHFSLLQVIIDDIFLTDLSQYRIQSYFNLDLIDNNIWGIKPGPTKAASDGFWIFLKPLPLGEHIIKFQGIEPNFRTDVTYNITIN
jgi:hypothetical protein